MEKIKLHILTGYSYDHEEIIEFNTTQQAEKFITDFLEEEECEYFIE